MERKELDIILFSNDEAKCLVDEKEYEIGLAKTIFGDWDKLNDYNENQRRRFKGISHYDFKIIVEKVEVKVEKEEKTFTEKPTEDEFPDLNKKEDEDEEDGEPEQLLLDDEKCSAITKSGSQCKMDKADGEELCHFHKSKKK
jgi:hypothetical protein